MEPPAIIESQSQDNFDLFCFELPQLLNVTSWTQINQVEYCYILQGARRMGYFIYYLPLLDLSLHPQYSSLQTNFDVSHNEVSKL